MVFILAQVIWFKSLPNKQAMQGIGEFKQNFVLLVIRRRTETVGPVYSQFAPFDSTELL